MSSRRPALAAAPGWAGSIERVYGKELSGQDGTEGAGRRRGEQGSKV